jgi:hypothetical protein
MLPSDAENVMDRAQKHANRASCVECFFLWRASKTKRRVIFQRLYTRAIDKADKGLEYSHMCHTLECGYRGR